MKNLKKTLALVIAVAMVFGLCVSSMAASITINAGDSATGTVSTEYTYYELLKASIDGDNVAYYLPVSTEGTALKTLLAAVTYTKGTSPNTTTVTPFSFTQSADGNRWNVTISSDVGDSDGELLAAALNTDAIKAAALASDDFSQSSGSAVADNLDPGLYLVTSTLGTKLVLQTLDDVEITTKNEYPTDTKTASTTNLEVGDTVTYTITIHVPESAVVGDTITVHDTLDEHLAIDTSTIAAVLGTDSVTLSDGTKKETTETFAKKFTITAAMLGNDVVITYDAELLSTAADDTGYVNSSFADISSYETTPSEVVVYTFDIDVDKTFTGIADDKVDEYEATFELRTSADGSPLEFILDSTGYVLADSDDTGTTTDLTITGGAAKNIRGLAEGTYYLVETATAAGFNQLDDPIIITITDTSTGNQPDITVSHTVSYKVGTSGTDTDGTNGIEVINNSGSVLPSTGGIGTTIFYVVGGILILGAGVLLVTRKRMTVQ